MRAKVTVLVAGVLLMATVTTRIDGQTSPLTMTRAMSPDEYAASGIGNLSPGQQATIDAWLNRWTDAAVNVSCGGTYANTGEKQSIEDNADGKVLFLDDGSMWLVSDVDQVDSSLWLAAEDVIVIDAKHPVAGFKYSIINAGSDGEQVLAKYLGQE